MSAKTIMNMVEWVEKNIEEEPTLEKMADYVGYSQYYCSAKFHEYTGVSFKEYVQTRKLSLAANDMAISDLKILDIAIKYGFSSNEAFTRSFTRQFGCTPSKYRREKRYNKKERYLCLN